MRRRDFIARVGSAAASPFLWPLAVPAQQRRLPVVGYVNPGLESAGEYVAAALRRGLGEQGYIEGRNVEILYRHAEGQDARLPALVEDLVRRQVDVLVAIGASATFVRSARAVTATIPIVFGAANDPVTDGLVASLNRPGGNVTGVFFLTGALVPSDSSCSMRSYPQSHRSAFSFPPAP